MAIDSSILADIGKPGQGYSPLAAIERVGQFQDARLKRQDDRAAREQQAAIAAVMQKHGGDYDAAIDELQRVSPMAALELSKTVEANRKAITERRKTELDNDRAEAEQFARLIGNGDESSWRAAGAYASQRSPEMAQFFRQPYTPELATQVKSWGMTAQQKFEAEQKAIESKRLEDWAAYVDSDPEEAEQAARVLLGPKAWAELQGQAAQRAEAARHNAATEAATLAGQDVTRRGQDIAAATQRRGQDISASTTRRGQDLTATRAAAGGKDGPNVGQIIGQIETLSKKINTLDSGPAANAQGWRRRALAAANLDNDVSEYNSLVEGMIPMVARAVGHTGVLTQQDVDSVRALFPAVGDNKTLAENKIRRVKELIAGAGSEASSPSDVPEGVASALTSVGDGRHTLSDGSVWEKRGNAITRVK